MDARPVREADESAPQEMLRAGVVTPPEADGAQVVVGLAEELAEALRLAQHLLGPVVVARVGQGLGQEEVGPRVRR